MPEIPAEAQPQAAPEAPQDPMMVLESVASGLSQLSEMLNADQSTTDDQRAKMSQIMQMVGDLAEEKLGGGEEGMSPADQGAVPAMGGMKGVPMGPQGMKRE